MYHAPSVKEPRSDPGLDRALLDFMDGLAAVASSELELRSTLEWVAAHVKERLDCDEVCIRFSQSDPRRDPSRTYVAQRASGIGSWPTAVAVSVVGEVLRDCQPLRTRDLLSDRLFAGLRNAQTTVRAALVVPLLAENTPIGVLAATEATPGRAWTDGEERLLAAISRHCGSVIERVRLREARVEVERLKQREQALLRENRYAADIQRHILPSEPLRLAGWEVAGRLVPASEVGGDGYDFRRLGDRRLCVTVSDVQGKGIPAAVLAISMQMLLREVYNGEWSLEEAQRHLCRDVAQAHSDRMVTLVAAELDLPSGMLRYYRAGHPYPLVRRHDGRIETLEEGGPLLGWCESVPMAIGHVLLERGDAVLFYTDGVSEAQDGRGRMFGEGHLNECWRAVGGLPAEAAVGRIIDTARDFSAGTSHEHDDDMAVVVLAAPRR